MKFGQMTLSKISPVADYLQLDICGLNKDEALNRYLKYNTKIPVILHGDWTKKGVSENDILKRERIEEYKNIIKRLKEETIVHALTLHPPYRRKIDFDSFVDIAKEIEEDTKISVLIENRSNKRIWLSKHEEIINFSKIHPMTLDIPQLYIGCEYKEDKFISVLEKLNWENIKEIHLANIMRKENRTFVARKVEDGIIDLGNVIKIFNDNSFVTLEILGGVYTFEKQKEIVENMNKKQTLFTF